MGIVTAMDAGAGVQAVLDLHPDLARARALKVAVALARAASPATDPTGGLQTRVATQLVPVSASVSTTGAWGVRASCCPPQSFLWLTVPQNQVCVECLFLRSLVICHGAVRMLKCLNIKTREFQDGMGFWG